MTDRDPAIIIDMLVAELKKLDARVAALERAASGAPAVTPDFLSFWSDYPRKVGKPDAMKAWAKLSSADRSEAAGAAKIFGNIWHAAPPDRRVFIPHPATWLRNRRWEDGQEEWRHQAFGYSNGNGHGHALVGSHGPAKHHAREINPLSPEWVRNTHAAMCDVNLRPAVPEHLTEAVVFWLSGDPINEPANWREELAEAWAEARRLAK